MIKSNRKTSCKRLELVLLLECIAYLDKIDDYQKSATNQVSQYVKTSFLAPQTTQQHVNFAQQNIELKE